MALAYPFVAAEMTESAPPPLPLVEVVVPSSTVTAVPGLLTLLPKPFPSDIDIKDKGFDIREVTLLGEEEVVDFGFGKKKGGGDVDRGGNNDDEEDEEEDEKVLIVVVVVEEPARVDELND